MTTRTALYRHYDANGQLLYVGITCDPARRLSEHIKAGKWDICEVTLEWYPARAQAEARERELIRAFKPPHNTVHAIAKSEPQEQGVFREAFIHSLSHSDARLSDIVNQAGVSRDVLNKLIARPGSSTNVENAIAIARFFGASVEQMIADAQEARQ